MNPRLRLVLVLVFGAVCSLAGWTAAQAGDNAILRPKSNEALALPAREDAPGVCDATRAGWMYLDLEVGEAVFPCVCAKNGSKVWDWIVVGAMPGKLCE